MGEDRQADKPDGCEEREKEILKRLLATPPDHRTKPKPGASPKKRGRPPKDKRDET